MKSSSRKAVALAVAAGIALPSSALATNGYFLIGYGSKSRAMGGAGIAFGQDAFAAAANPATMADVKLSTMRIDVSAELFQPPRAVRVEATPISTRDPDTNNLASIKSGSNLFLIPAMGGIYKFNRRITIGMTAIGAGSNTRYKQRCNSNSPIGNYFNIACSASDTVGVNLMQMQMLPSIAYKVNRHNYVGASLAIAVQTFRAYGIDAGAFKSFSSDKNHFSNKGNDWSYGAGIRIGWLGKFFRKRLKIGIDYNSRVYMSKFKKYRGLFAEHGDFDIPANYGIGIAIRPTKKLWIAFDAVRTEWSSIKSIANPGPNVRDTVNNFNVLCPNTIISSDPECQLGGNKGWGFGWKDRTAYKLGFNYDYDRHWTFRAGLNYGKTPVREDQILFNTLAPATVEKHLTLGFSYRPNSMIEWSFNYMHAFKNVVKGPAAFPAGATPGQASAGMYQNSLGATFSFKM